MNSSAETDQECEEEGGGVWGHIGKTRVTQKDGGWLAAGQTLKNRCSAAGAVCSVVSKVTGADCRGSGGGTTQRREVWWRGGGLLRHREGRRREVVRVEGEGARG